MSPRALSTSVSANTIKRKTATVYAGPAYSTIVVIFLSCNYFYNNNYYYSVIFFFRYYFISSFLFIVTFARVCLNLKLSLVCVSLVNELMELVCLRCYTVQLSSFQTICGCWMRLVPSVNIVCLFVCFCIAGLLDDLKH